LLLTHDVSAVIAVNKAHKLDGLSRRAAPAVSQFSNLGQNTITY